MRIITATLGVFLALIIDGPCQEALAAGAPTKLSVPASITVTEGQSAPLRVCKSGGNGRATTVAYSTADGAANAGLDYAARSGSFSLGSSCVILNFTTTDDSLVEASEGFTVNLSIPSTGFRISAVVYIQDNDVAPVPARVPEPTPTPLPVPTGDVLSPSLDGEIAIPSNFDTAPEFGAAPVPVSNAPDPRGAFRFICDAGQVLADDPIVFPGQPGRSHLHQFYGNTGADANSTYESLRTTGRSTCMSPLNRSAYWMPAMLDGRGYVVRPDYVQIYYKRYPAGSAECQQRAALGCVMQPNGIRWISGRDMLNPAAPATGGASYICEGVSGTWTNIRDALANCVAGKHFYAQIDGPDCWRGNLLDSADHRSHVARMVDTHLGYPACPSGFPYLIPTFHLSAAYLLVAGEDTSKWAFSCDAMFPNEAPGACFHIDLWDAWDHEAKDSWTHRGCIDKQLNCASGILGDGRRLNQTEPFSWTANPRLVPVSTVPQTPVR